MSPSPNPTALTTANLSSAIAAAQSKISRFAGNVPFLFYKAALGTAGWQLGKEAINVAGEEVLLMASTIRKGYVAFTNADGSTGRFLGEIQHPLFSPGEADITELEVYDGAKISAASCVRVCFVGRDNLNVEFKGSTFGVVSALDTLADQILELLKRGETTYINPLVQLEVGSYKHKTRGLIWTPELPVTAWCDLEGRTAADVEAEKGSGSRI